MPERVRANHEAGLIEVESEGVVTKDENASALAEVVTLSRETGFFRVLADTRRQAEVPSIFAILRFAESLPRHLVYALIAEGAQPTGEIIDLLRIMINARGTRLAVFGDRDAALAWLRTMPRPAPAASDCALTPAGTVPG